jgi:hypothetical protein
MQSGEIEMSAASIFLDSTAFHRGYGVYFSIGWINTKNPPMKGLKGGFLG